MGTSAGLEQRYLGAQGERRTAGLLGVFIGEGCAWGGRQRGGAGQET